MDSAPTQEVDGFQDVDALEHQIADLFEEGDAKTILELLVKKSPRRLERELLNTGHTNDWVGCFRTDLTEINAFLQIRSATGTIDPELHTKVNTRLNALIKETNEIRKGKKEYSKEDLSKKLEKILED